MRKTPFGVGFGYRELDYQNTSPQECWDVEMRKTPFGEGFRYQDLECRNTSPKECRNDEMSKCKKHLLV
jgi:hypothetical protein